ncbi:MAG TPA: ABC transporter permease [Euzebyales bacterium]|nr:ABC transporter permease [Euzebyales bacterium]
MNWGPIWPWLLGQEHETLRIAGVPTLLLEHLLYVAVSVLAAIAIALPIGLWVGHVNRGGTLAVNISNAGRAIPSLGVIVIAFLAFGRSPIPVFITLIAMAIPPILTNTYVGVREVDPEVRDAAVGMGLSGWDVVRRVEIPMALPVIMAGIRTSAVQVVATATLAAFVALGGLGRPIFTGLATSVQFNPDARTVVVVAVILVALFAIAVEQVLGMVERLVVPRGLAHRQAQDGAPPPRPDADAVRQGEEQSAVTV